MTVNAIAISTTPVASQPKSKAKLIVFGLDDGGKPHASQFEEADAALATKAAGLMGMRTLTVETDEHQELAAQLPQGRVFASGKGFVPFVKKALYDRLSALAGPIVAAPTNAEANDAGTLPQRPSGNVTEVTELRPAGWDSIQAGATVLVHGGGEDGWYEANVVESKTDDLFVLRWRDWPELPVLVRTRAHIALLNPTATAAEV